jgi:hypothetical protein
VAWCLFSTFASVTWFGLCGLFRNRCWKWIHQVSAHKSTRRQSRWFPLFLVSFLLPCVIVKVLDCGLSLLTNAIIARSFLLLVRGLRWKRSMWAMSRWTQSSASTRYSHIWMRQFGGCLFFILRFHFLFFFSPSRLLWKDLIPLKFFREAWVIEWTCKLYEFMYKFLGVYTCFWHLLVCLDIHTHIYKQLYINIYIYIQCWPNDRITYSNQVVCSFSINLQS